MESNSKQLIRDLLDTSQFKPAMADAIKLGVVEAEGRMLAAVREGNPVSSSYFLGVLETYKGLVAKLESFADSPKRTN